MADDITIKPAGAKTSGKQQALGANVVMDVKSPKQGSIILGGDDDEIAATKSQYTVPVLVKEKFPDLIQLIKETESMNDEERNYWFQILPIMTEEQIKKFRDILVHEKEQLARLDSEYEKELQKLNDKHLVEWKEFEAREKRQTIAASENASEAEEKAKEEELLQRLSQL